MALRPNLEAVIEEMPADNAVETKNEPASAVQTQKPTVASVTQTPTAVAVKTQSAVSTSVKGFGKNPFDALKDAARVDFNDLVQLKLKPGHFIERESGIKLGEWVDLQLLSFQDSFVVSPNDIKAPKELVRYSEDGITCNDGTPCFEHLQELKDQGHHKASIQPRVVLVGAVLDAEKDKSLVDELVQISLAPKAKGHFKTYQMGLVWKLQTRKVTPENVLAVRLTATPAVGPDNTDYTTVKFSMRPVAA